jgi:hypothetical protein
MMFRDRLVHGRSPRVLSRDEDKMEEEQISLWRVYLFAFTQAPSSMLWNVP